MPSFILFFGYNCIVNKQYDMNPSFEKIIPSFGHTFALRKFENSNPNLVPYWHFHPEIEIVYIKHGSGKRHIGNHLSYYNGGDLILLGPNLPHYGFTDRLFDSNSEIVVQMKTEFLGKEFFSLPEMDAITQLLEKSKSGISFYGNTKIQVGAKLNSLFYMNQFDQLIELIKILQILAESKEYQILNASGVTLIVQKQDTSRIDTIYKYVRSNFKETIILEDIAEISNMTVPSFCRYFKKSTGKTFTTFVNEFRLVHACKLLNEEQFSVTEVCFECGFNNISHFNKLFKAKTGKNPNAYRKQLEKIVYEDAFLG